MRLVASSQFLWNSPNPLLNSLNWPFHRLRLRLILLEPRGIELRMFLSLPLFLPFSLPSSAHRRFSGEGESDKGPHSSASDRADGSRYRFGAEFKWFSCFVWSRLTWTRVAERGSRLSGLMKSRNRAPATFSFSFFFSFLSLTAGPACQCCLVSPNLYPELYRLLIPQFCVPSRVSRTSKIHIKLTHLRFSGFLISKFMVYYLEFDYEFYFPKSCFLLRWF